MTGKLLAYHLKSPRVPLVVRIPQFENHCSNVSQPSPAVNENIRASRQNDMLLQDRVHNKQVMVRR